MTNNEYKLKKYISNSQYSDFNAPTLLKDIADLKIINFTLRDNDKERLNASKIELPERSFNDLVRLLNHFDIGDLESEF